MSGPKEHQSAEDIASIVLTVGSVLSETLCCQGYLLIVMDDHSEMMPAVENILKRPLAERERAAQVLRMWATRIERGETGRGEG